MSEAHTVTFRFLAEPTDVNFGGKVHGGTVMKWIDQASYACAAKWSKRYCVTVSANAIRFIKPVKVGQMVEVKARIVHTGRTSMHIYVSIKAGDPKVDVYKITNRCFITFMAVDEEGNPTEVPTFVPKTDEDKMLESVVMKAKDFAKKLDLEFELALGWK
jgi:uncharacterized protein (TIGR00369 family)